LKIPSRNIDSNHVFHQYTIKLDENIVRDDLIQYLAKKNIPAMVYYPVPAHLQKMFSKIPNTYGDMKVTNWLSSRVFSLPMHTELSTLQQDYITDNLFNYLKIK
jgi:dTDP-4-amino-4,6-dideoxygalactose transaminase